MIDLKKYLIVHEVAGERIVLEVSGYKSSELDFIISLGFFDDGNYLVRPIDGMEERLALLKVLIKLGALFSAGGSWSPAEILEHYSKQGIINEPYKVIAWKAAHEYVIYHKDGA